MLNLFAKKSLRRSLPSFIFSSDWSVWLCLTLKSGLSCKLGLHCPRRTLRSVAGCLVPLLFFLSFLSFLFFFKMTFGKQFWFWRNARLLAIVICWEESLQYTNESASTLRHISRIPRWLPAFILQRLLLYFCGLVTKASVASWSYSCVSKFFFSGSSGTYRVNSSLNPPTPSPPSKKNGRVSRARFLPQSFFLFKNPWLKFPLVFPWFFLIFYSFFEWFSTLVPVVF